MRIVAGKYRGMTLAAFRGEEIRPTSDRVKESLFQILTPRLFGARVLDLFCGSGALGIESLSRGAAEVWFNDCSEQSLAVLKKNLQRVEEPCRVTRLDFRACLRSAEGEFDLIFSDPPYRENYLAELCALAAGKLRQGGLVVHESEREELPPEGWERADMRRYGRTIVTFFAKRGDTV